MTYRIFALGLLMTISLSPGPQTPVGQDAYFVPRSQFDNVGVVYSKAGKVPLQLREVWIMAPGYKTPNHLSLLVMFEPVTGAFSWRTLWSPGLLEGPWQSEQATDLEGAFLKDGELTDFRPIELTLFIHAYRGHAANMNEAVTKSLKAASELLDPLKDMDKEQGVHMVFVTRLDRDFTMRPNTSAPGGVTTKVLDVQWDGKYWTLLLESRWKARVVLDADYNVISATKVQWTGRRSR